MNLIMFFEIIFEGIKQFAGEIIGVLLFIVAWKMSPRFRSLFGQYNKLKDNNLSESESQEEKQKSPEQEKQQQEVQLKKVLEQSGVERAEEAKREEEERLIALRAEVERQKKALAQIEAQKAEDAKRRKKRPAMSDWDFIKLCEYGNVGKVEEAIKDGANVNAEDNDGWTALMWAVFYVYTEIVKLLLEHGADVNAKSNNGWTALHLAEGHSEIVRLLRYHVAKEKRRDEYFIELCKFGNVGEVEEAIKEGANINAKDNYGATALMEAANEGNTAIVKLLLKHGADVNAEDNYGTTALWNAELNDHQQIAKLLRSHGAKEY